MTKHTPQEIFFIVLGWLSFTLGVIGFFLPVLPTVPFLVLTAYCFSRGSPRLYNWLMSHKWFAKPILDWQKYRVIKLSSKIIATLMLLTSSAFMLMRPTVTETIKIVYSIVIVGVLVFIWSQRNRPPESAEKS